MNGQKKSHDISLYLSISLPLPQHSTKERLLFSQEILCNFLESPQENQVASLRQIEHEAIPIFVRIVIYFQNVMPK